jgi:hypothetical protein
MARLLRTFVRWLVILVALAPTLAATTPANADAPANSAFWRTWARHDKVVTEGGGPRTWMWGPAAFSGSVTEDYAEGVDPTGTGGQRVVQYYDKARMEITNWQGDASQLWHVTNGLLVVELVTGRIQVGHAMFEERWPAEVNVAGDPDDEAGQPGGPTPPTYASFGQVLDLRPDVGGLVIDTGIQRDGTFYTFPRFTHYGIRTVQYVPETRHWIAGPFWNFMTSQGPIFVPSGNGTDGTTTTGPLFENPFYATGFPISEAYWSVTKVAGTYKDVLIQCFERRCLTFTPDNPDVWQVEAGNVGQHYYVWRYCDFYDCALPEQAPGTIVFIRSRPVTEDTESHSIAAIHADGSGERLIGPAGEHPIGSAWSGDWAPQISPDGTRIAWAASVGDQTDIFVAGIDGTNTRNLTDTPASDETRPSWSPDGELLAYERVDTAGDEPPGLTIWRMRADGSQQHMLADGGRPRWSWDGGKIAFLASTETSVGRWYDVRTINPDGTGLEYPAGCAGDFAWTPAGALIIIPSTYPSCFYAGVHIVGDDQANENLRAIDGVRGDFAFSPDGTKVAFRVDHPDVQGMFVANADFSLPARLSESGIAESQPAWSPDSRWVAFRGSQNGESGIYAVDVARRSVMHRVTFSPATTDALPAWAP